MPKTYTVSSVVDVRAPGARSPHWRVQFEHDDDAYNSVYFFPHETLEWRIAEYGIDVNDFDTLLDIVIHEQYVDLQHTDPTFLYNTDQETARVAHLARTAESKKIRTHHDPDNLLDVIRKAHDPKSPRIDEFRRHVLKVRASADSGANSQLDR